MLFYSVSCIVCYHCFWKKLETKNIQNKISYSLLHNNKCYAFYLFETSFIIHWRLAWLRGPDCFMLVKSFKISFFHRIDAQQPNNDLDITPESINHQNNLCKITHYISYFISKQNMPQSKYGSINDEDIDIENINNNRYSSIRQWILFCTCADLICYRHQRK